MRLTRFPRLLSAALAGVAVGGLVAAGWNITAPAEPATTANETARASISSSAPNGAADDAGPGDDAGAADDAGPGDADGPDGDAGPDGDDGGATSRQAETNRGDEPNPGERAAPQDQQAGAPGAAEQAPGEAEPGPESARPVLDLEPLEQPEESFPEPDMPGRPGEESAELTRIEYELKRLTWIAVGQSDEDTEVSCSEDTSTLSQPGDYEFPCDVTVHGVDVRFNIEATVTDSEVQWAWSAGYFAVSERKAVHEATRQSFKPARVTCNFVGVEKVRIGAKDGLRCWVTRPDGDQMTYHAEMLRDGSLVFRPGREP